ncbi:hypothetical protein H1P_1220011 [Hyella patelloides LEGE 07179]|uniref:Uncharacterized protein n=1 Tax=Hyella patelloides LEGE 07179 TaxID=945734 RepID=A0A563VKA8_9CYAN|nr:hypothetical protein H1P_1220011 [Hyella patelloides LEGE 07179]
MFYAIFIFNWIPAFVFQEKSGLDYLHCQKTIFDLEIYSDIYSKITAQILLLKIFD